MKKILRWPILWWLRFWARLVLAKTNPIIIGVTGSAGKTSLVKAIEPIVRLKFDRVKIAKKANSESGIPADILGLHFTNYSPFDWLRVCLLAPIKTVSYFATPASPAKRGGQASRTSHFFDGYVVEMGVDEPNPPKNMGYLLSILQPDIGIILNVLPVHTEQFEHQLGITDQETLIKAIAREKGKLISSNSRLKIAIINADQPEITGLKLPEHQAKILSFGTNTRSSIRAVSIEPSLAETVITLEYNKQKWPIKLINQALPEYYGDTIAAAFAVGIALRIEPVRISQVLSDNFSLPPGRGRVYRGIRNSIIIDSSYNASRVPMIGALVLLNKVAGTRTKIAVLGDMRELGSQAKTEYQEVAKALVQTADKTVLIGPLMKQYVRPILKQKNVKANWFENAGQAALYLIETLPKKSVILVKGSQNSIFLEIVVEALLANKKDSGSLCRRGAYWDKLRQTSRQGFRKKKPEGDSGQVRR